VPRSRRSLTVLARVGREAAGRTPVDFDPVVVGEAECAAWSAYYRRDWPGVLRGVLTMVRSGFALGPVGNLRGAWYVLRANQVWAPDQNDPAAARRLMARFYRLAQRAGRIQVDPVRAAELEVEWWRLHRQHQRSASITDEDLVAALVRLYAFLYGTGPEVVRFAAVHRVGAMAHSDAWVRGGCTPGDPLLDAERAALIASYRSLRAVQDRGR
jgi:hypothetical protein